MIDPPLRLTCIEVRRRVEENSFPRPLFVKAIDGDGAEYSAILKVRNPDSPLGHGHYQGTSLACELIFGALAQSVGLTVPDYCLVEVRGGLQDAAPTQEIRDLLRNNLGLNCGTIYIEGCSPWVASREGEQRPESVCADLEDVLVFDSVVVNGDRKQEKSNLLWNGSDVILIDHSVALPVHLWTDEQIAGSPLFPETEIRAHCAFHSIEHQGREFSALLGIWRNSVTDQDITALRAFIPDTWERRQGDLDRIFSFLQERGGQFDATTQNLRRIVK